LRAKNEIEGYSRKLSKVLEKEYFREEELQFAEAGPTGFMKRLHITGQMLTPFQIKLLFKNNDQKNKWDVISGLNNGTITSTSPQHRELGLNIFHDQSSSTNQSSPKQVQTPIKIFSTKDRPFLVDDLDNPDRTSTSRSANSQSNEYSISHVSVIPPPQIARDENYFGASQLLRPTEAINKAISESFGENEISEAIREFSSENETSGAISESFGENDAQLRQLIQSSQLIQTNKEILGAEHFIPKPGRSMTHSSDKQSVQANESGELVDVNVKAKLNTSMRLDYLLGYTLI
jgi:hypothetical protein